ncbi:MAG: cyclic nucleotide-binding domain-containing protein [Proteobacteria bacterium]|nr:cyclic nucleotide-binding domain-containing protein [Pseudomonadota bacterium]MBU1742898.1 cyclic nucleotide-binding domain-containing protein [Pseudomonadota bacterium]
MTDAGRPQGSSIVSDVDVLARVRIFSSLNKRHLNRITKLVRNHRFQTDEVIIRQGERDGRLFIVVSGMVEVIKNLGQRRERTVQTIKPPGYFGEMALIDDLERSATVIAREETHVISLEQLHLRQAMAEHPSIAIELLKTLSGRIRTIEKGMVNILGGLLPICANCKNIRQEDGSWTRIETYIANRSEAVFSHGICPDCARELYPEIYKDRQTD